MVLSVRILYLLSVIKIQTAFKGELFVQQILVLATTNQGKKKELTQLLQDFPVDIRTLEDFAPIPEVEEDGKTFAENAYKKAAFTAKALNLPAMADDSGLCVEALENAPGVYSARFAGENATDEDNMAKLLTDMESQDNRKASFHCVISIALPSGDSMNFEGSCTGVLTRQPVGENGFGYDPLFFFPELGKTFAQLLPEEKASISHRGNALKHLTKKMDKVLEWIQMNPAQTHLP